MIIPGKIGLIVDGIVFLIILFLLYVLSGVWPPDSPWAPWWQMPKEIIRRMYRLVHLSSKDIVYELGCGTGNAMIIANKEFSAKAIGIEIDPLRFILAHINVFKHRAHVTLIKENFFHVDLTQATVLIIYLVPNALKRLAPKLLKELKPGVKLVSYKYKFPLEIYKKKLRLVKEDKKNEIYLYEMK